MCHCVGGKCGMVYNRLYHIYLVLMLTAARINVEISEVIEDVGNTRDTVECLFPYLVEKLHPTPMENGPSRQAPRGGAHFLQAATLKMFFETFFSKPGSFPRWNPTIIAAEQNNTPRRHDLKVHKSPKWQVRKPP